MLKCKLLYRKIIKTQSTDLCKVWSPNACMCTREVVVLQQRVDTRRNSIPGKV